MPQVELMKGIAISKTLSFRPLGNDTEPLTEARNDEHRIANADLARSIFMEGGTRGGNGIANEMKHAHFCKCR